MKTVHISLDVTFSECNKFVTVYQQSPLIEHQFDATKNKQGANKNLVGPIQKNPVT